MHFAFIPYGKRSEVELLLRDMEAQKHLYKMWKDNCPDKAIWMQGQVRILPFGIVEYIFPRENLNAVLNTLITEDEERYKLVKWFYKTIRMMLKLKPIPEYKKENHYLWIKENVGIIPLGIKEDADMPDYLQDNYIHEAI